MVATLLTALSHALAQATAAGDLEAVLRIRSAWELLMSGETAPPPQPARPIHYEAALAEIATGVRVAIAEDGAAYQTQLAEKRESLSRQIDHLIVLATQAGHIDEAYALRQTKQRIIDRTFSNAAGAISQDGTTSIPLMTVDPTTGALTTRLHLVRGEKLSVFGNYRGRESIIYTHPFAPNDPACLAGRVDLPLAKSIKLVFGVSDHPVGDWQLLVKVDKQVVKDILVGPESTGGQWLDVEIDLSDHAGQAIALELLNVPTGWSYEFAYWHDVRLVIE